MTFQEGADIQALYREAPLREDDAGIRSVRFPPVIIFAFLNHYGR
jgi:hypothetical protein